MSSVLGLRQGACFTLASVALVLLSASPAQSAETLRWKFQPGKSIAYEMQQNMEMHTTIRGQKIKTATSQTMDLTWHVDSVSRDGSCRMTQTIDRIRLSLEGPTGTVEYDSSAEEQPNDALLNTLRPVFESMVGAQFSLKMDALGHVSDVRIPEQFRKSLKDQPAGQMGAFSEESMKQMVEQASLILPQPAVSTNQKWNSQSEFDMPFGVLKTNNQMTYVGPARTGNVPLENIRMTSSVRVETAPDSPLGIELKEQATSGTIQFDNAAGHVHGSTVTQKMVMTVKADGQSMQQNVTQTRRLQIKQPQTAGTNRSVQKR